MKGFKDSAKKLSDRTYEVLEAEIQVILDLGVELRLNTPLGPDLTLADLKDQGYEAIFIAVGAHKSRGLHIEGVELDGVLQATDFLLNVNRGYRVDLGKRVVVVISALLLKVPAASGSLSTPVMVMVPPSPPRKSGTRQT